MKQLEINGIAVPVKSLAALTVQGAQIGEMQSGAAYTNRVELLETVQTHKAVGDPKNVFKQIITGWQPARLLIGGVDMLFNSGRAKVVDDGIGVEIRGGAFTFFGLCRNTQLQDLAWDEYDFIMSGSDITSRTGIADPIAFPLIGWGYDGAASPEYTVINGGGQVVGFPDILVSTVVEKICSGLGYSLVQAPENGWDVLSVPFCGSVFQNGKRYFSNNNISLTATTGAATLSGTSVTITAPTIYSLRVGGGGGSFRFANANADWFNAAFSVFVSSYSLALDAGIVSLYQLRLEIYADSSTPGVDLPMATTIIQDGVGSYGSARTYDVGRAGELLAGQGVEAHLVLEVVPAGPFVTITYNASLINGSTGELEARGLIDISGRTVTAEAILPAWDCAKFLQNTLQHAGAFCFVDEDTKQVAILSVSQLDTLKGFGPDWTRNFRGKDGRSVQFGAFAETNWLRFADDGEANENAGAGTFVVPRQDDGTSKDFVRLDFGPSKNSITAGVRCAEVLLWETDDNSNRTRKATDTIRLLRRTTVNPAFSMRYAAGATAPNALVARFDGPATLSYAASNQYATVATWVNLGDEYQITLQLSLREVLNLWKMREIGGLNITGGGLPIYLQQLNGYFLLKELTEWQDGDTTCHATLTRI